jgi:hypothetical protein
VRLIPSLLAISRLLTPRASISLMASEWAATVAGRPWGFPSRRACAIPAFTRCGAGGPLAAESLANVLAVHLIRHVLAPGRHERRRDGALPRARLRAVLEYIEEHLDASPTLEQIAAVARLRNSSGNPSGGIPPSY